MACTCQIIEWLLNRQRTTKTVSGLKGITQLISQTTKKAYKAIIIWKAYKAIIIWKAIKVDEKGREECYRGKETRKK